MKKNLLSYEVSDLKEIFKRIKTGNFSGTEGVLIRNSTYQFLAQIMAKFGSLVLTIILARMLMPELFGLYALTVSTVMVFMAFSDFGIGTTLIRFLSNKISRNKLRKAKGYFIYLTKLKIFLVLIVISVLILSARFIAENYYQKPIFLALLSGVFFVIAIELTSLMKSSFQASNKFGMVFLQEILFQTFRIALIFLAIFVSLKYLLEKEIILALIILALSLASFTSFTFLLAFSKRKLPFLKTKAENLTKKEKNVLNRFVLAISLTAFSGVFFTYIDRIMLGRFVEAQFIGYYSAAFSFIGASIPLITFSAALLPVFSGLTRNRLKVLFRKSTEVILSISIILSLIFLVLAPYIIQIIFGSEYLLSINILRIFSLLLIPMAMIALLSTYLASIGKPALITKSLLIASVLNVFLNFIFISWLINYGQIWGVYGAVFATIISNVVYLSLLIISKNKLL